MVNGATSLRVGSVSASRKPAIFSDDRKYRYRLYRDLGSGNGTFVWVGKNPSDADEEKNDSSVTRVRKRAAALGYRHFVVVNLYAYVSKDPRGLLDSSRDADGPVGRHNLKFIKEAVREADYVLVAWGHDYVGPMHAEEVLEEILALGGDKLYRLGIGRHGSPIHPGRCRADARAVPWIP